MSVKNYSDTFLKICGILTFVFVFIYCAETILNPSQRYFEKIECKTKDWRALLGRKTPADPRLVFIAIDQQNYESLYPAGTPIGEETALICRQWPWSRKVWAIAIDKLVQSGAKVVALDLLFPNPSTEFPKDDKIFQDALVKYHDNVVIGFNIVTDTYKSAMSETRNERAYTLQFPSKSVAGDYQDPKTAPIWKSMGFVNVWQDEVDGVLRNADYALTDPAAIPLDAFSKKIIEKMGETEVLKNLPHETIFRYSYEPSTQSRFSTEHDFVFRAIPFYQIFDSKIWERNFGSGAFFKDKVIIIGPISNFFQDKHTTPYPSPMPGPKIHISTVNAALHGEYIEETSRITDILTILLFGGISCFLCYVVNNPRNRAYLLVLVNVLFVVGSILIFDYFNLYILCFLPFLTLNTSVFFCDLFEIIAERKERARVRSHLERYVSKNVVRMLLENPEKLQGRKTITILFSDLRGFTTLTESADAEALVRQLNEYLTQMVKCVFQNKGTLDKFIGDAVMAIWGNAETEGTEIDAQRAVQCALDMIDELRKLNAKWKLEGKPELKVGIGINHGQAIVGNMGSDDKAYERMEFTVIGDSVNTASRLEGLTKEYHAELLLGETVEPLVDKEFQLRSVALVQLKGKTRPTEVFSVLGKIDPLQPKPKPDWLVTYQNAIHLYRKREFYEALVAFKIADAQKPDDYLIGEYIESCEEFIKNPPDESWTGVIVMKTK
jgi:adenylate cyclase